MTVQAITTVTNRIIERSRSTRLSYLNKVKKAESGGRARSHLSCGNLAHGMATCSAIEKKLVAGEEVANIGIVTAYNDMLSAHQPYKTYPDLIKSTASRLGVTAQIAGGVPAMCDGVTQGQPGMELSLFSRDVIAMSTAVSLSHDMFDGVICLGVCDKIVPGLLIGALSFGHLPTIFLPAGPMTTGQSNDAKAKVRQQYAEGKVGRDVLLASESKSYHGPGTCTFYGTANSNQMLMEIMGLHIPGSSFIPPNTSLRDALTRKGVETLVSNIDQSPTPLYKIITEKAIVNGLVGLLATGGSTNHAIHLVAIAKAAGIIINWKDMSDLSESVPLLTRIYPNGKADINHFQAAGGMSFLMRELSTHGYLNQDVCTLMGEGLSHYYDDPTIQENNAAEIFREKNDTEHSKLILNWTPSPKESLDNDILRPALKPFSKDGGLKLLNGNIGRAVIKSSAVAKENQIVEAPAVVFDDQNDLVNAFENNQLNKDFIAVIRFQGPKANGMPELHKLTPILSSLQSAGYSVALVTDGRMSGASGKIPAAIHLVPEALDGGNIAKIVDGDLIQLNAVTGELSVDLSPSDLENRKIESKTKFDDQSGMGREIFGNFRNCVNSAEEGASALASSSASSSASASANNKLESERVST